MSNCIVDFGVKSITLFEVDYNKKDIKIVNGVRVVKRKYGKYKRISNGFKMVDHKVYD